MALILFSTTDMRGPRRADFTRLLDSLERNAKGGQALRSYILLQNCPHAQLAMLQTKAPACCRLTAIESRCSVSVARNLLIAAALECEPFGADDIVGFPDDDCWLPDHFAGSLANVFAELEDLDVLICKVAGKPDLRAFAAREIVPASTRQIVRVTTSNSMFFRGPVFVRVGRFDPALGVGTPNGGGEDTDYVIRAFLAARRAGIIDRPVVAHPEPDQDSAAKYYRGALIVLARHAGGSPALMREFLRKLLVGGYFVVRRKLSLSALLAAFWDALRTRRTGEPSLTSGATRP